MDGVGGPDEEARLRTLREYQILDTPPEAVYDELVRIASLACDAPISLITLIDRERQWFKAERGFGRRETPRSLSFCAHAIGARDAMIIPNAVDDPRFRDNDLVVGAQGIRFYAGTPLLAYNGLPLGTLCIIDDRPRELEARHRETLIALGHQVEALLEQRRLGRELHEALERKHTLVRFVIHDLTNALAVVSLDAQLLRAKVGEPSPLLPVVADLDRGAACMRRILHSLRDVDRADRGLLVAGRAAIDAPALVTEIGARWQGVARASRREVAVVADPATPVLAGDRGLLERVLDNLVANAIDFAPEGTTVTVACAPGDDGGVALDVADHGPGIPEKHRERIFDLYATIDDAAPVPVRTATGLGLAFCRRAIDAHGGRIWIESQRPSGSVFRIALPAGASPDPDPAARA